MAQAAKGKLNYRCPSCFIRDIDIDALRETVGTDGFYDCLRDYLIGICPALAYEVRK